MKKILLTGAGGFVGSHLAQRLLDHGHSVVGVDNFCTGRKKNVSGLGDRFTLIEADVSKPLPQSIISQKWDWVMHFASPASPPKYFGLPVETLLVNSEGTRQLLELCRKHPQQTQFFYASTSEVYGDPLVHPQPETYWGNVNSIGVRSIYDEGKRYGEAMTYAYHRTHQIKVRVIRIFNTYGPRMDPEDGRVVTNLMFQALRGEPMTVYGDGKQTRSFQYVSDLVDGIVKLMDSDYVWPVNLGNPEEFTILEFAQKVKALISSRSEIVFRDLPSDDPKQRKPDISLALQELKWQPKVKLDQGLALTLEHFKKEL